MKRKYLSTDVKQAKAFSWVFVLTRVPQQTAKIASMPPSLSSLKLLLTVLKLKPSN